MEVGMNKEEKNLLKYLESTNDARRIMTTKVIGIDKDGNEHESTFEELTKGIYPEYRIRFTDDGDKIPNCTITDTEVTLTS